MSDETGPRGICGHVAVRLDQYILAFGGTDVENEAISKRIIWIYNLYTEKWKKHTIPGILEAPPTFYEQNSAVAIGSDVYMFDGRTYVKKDPDNALWMLSTSIGNIYWKRIISECTPSYRCDHSGWEHEGKMWIFGGYYGIMSYCNELLCFNPSTNEWTTPKCSGSVPTPLGQHATTQVKDKVWLFGGMNPAFLDDLFELDMSSLTWTEIPTTQPRPNGRLYFSLNAITESKLLLHGSMVGVFDTQSLEEQPSEEGSSWIMDLPSQSWKKCFSFEGSSHSHTGTTGLNKCVIMIGGQNSYNSTFSLRLEPKLLQQLAAQTIDKHKDLVQWKYLPNKLIAILGY